MIKDLDDINTPVCEQLFKKINRHTNCKSMNEARYFLFWMYNLDMHNLDIEGLDSCMPDPRSEFRWTQIKIMKVDFKSLPQKQKMGFLAEQFSKVDLENSTKAKIETVSKFSCELCNAGYQAEGYLKKHMSEKHGLGGGKLIECLECGSFLSSKQALQKHVQRIHRVCKICKKDFETDVERDKHQVMHTTCDICDVVFSTVSKLDRHKNQVHKDYN